MSTLDFAGVRVLKTADATQVDLGPLASLVGTWTSPETNNQGWNVIAVPGPQGFILEVIPYKETLTFSPVVVAGNRGPFVNGEEQVQNIVGLLYEQSIISVCDTEVCNERGFANGTEIHAETGLFLYLSNETNDYDIARLSTIPHGNSLLALGTSTQSPNPGNAFIPDNSTIPFPNPKPGMFGYFDPYGQPFAFPNFATNNPNMFLQKAISEQTITALTTLNFSTGFGTGGVLNIPFIQKNINTTRVDATFWIETLADGSLQLQYSQDISLLFPPTGSDVIVTWPHVTINTLTKQ